MSLSSNTTPAVEAENESAALAELLRLSLEAAEPLWADNDDIPITAAWRCTVTTNQTAKWRRWDKTAKLSLHDWYGMVAKPDVRADKDGPCYVPGTLVGNERKAPAVKQIDLLVYDLDGSALAEIEGKADALGRLAWLHSTHSHLSTKTLIATNHIERWAKPRKVEYPLSQDDMRAYLADPANRKSYLTSVLYDATERVQTPDGIMQVVHHDPCEKYRLIIPLATPIVLAELGASSATSIARYKAIYNGVARNLGLAHDTSCEDPSRLYYFPSRREGAEYVARLYGSMDDPVLYDWRTFEVPPEEASPEAKAPKRPKTKSPTRLKIADDFDMESLLRDSLDPSEIGPDRDKGGFHITCPHAERHSKPGGMGTFVANADGDHPWTIYCCHDGCSDLNRFDHVQKLIDDGKLRADEFGAGYAMPRNGGFVVPLGQLPSALDQINEDWAAIIHGGKSRYLRLRHDGSIELANKDAFLAHFEAAYYQYEVPAGDGKTKIQLGKLGPKWLSWTGRRQYTGMDFFPGKLSVPEHVYNTYQGFGVEPKRGSWKRLLGHVYRVHCHRNPVWFRYYIAWLAQLVQEPEVKIGTAIVVKGAEGSGKNKVGDWILRMMGAHGMLVSKPDQITGKFNRHLATTLFLFANEAFWAGDKAAEGALKTLITEKDDTVEAKGIDAVKARNYTRIYIATNHDWAVPADSGGRRFFVLETTNDHVQDIPYFKAIDAEMESGGLAAMLYDLQRHNYAAVSLQHVPVTQWLVQQRLHSGDNKKRWLRDVIMGGGFRSIDGVTGGEAFKPLALAKETEVPKAAVFASAKPFFGTERRKATQTEIGTWLRDQLEGTTFALDGPRVNAGGKRDRTYVIPALRDLAAVWEKMTGEVIDVEVEACAEPPETEEKRDPHKTFAKPIIPASRWV